ncbi:MAG: cysteine desulfuration protein SufE [Morganella sp. (in: enterobacteria)]|uniref:Cysteine desufuration protein SufE n=1 Tax=Morganella psychrotolerans TaxID=368603 RepID=A0A1B8HTS7_9GAMM|nr:cysteine desulfuration protein SufE [Morganella psychrotolerans]OBU13283.1 cysteine desufuration protein SufE [Morganella psychrotolerans]
MKINLPDQAKLLRNFARCHDWEERYLYLIELGEKLPALTEMQRVAQHKISGCQSQVWIAMQQDDEGRVWFAGDSDAAIVKGLVALVIALYQGKLPDEIRALDIADIFNQLALSVHLTPSRTQGLNAMVRTILQNTQQMR